MKNILLGSLLSLLSFGALAQDVTEGRQFKFGSTNLRVGTYCELTVAGDKVYTGLCHLARNDGSTNTVVQAGNYNFLIQREPFDNTTGKFYWIRNGRKVFLDDVNAVGSCWIGSGIKYCAK